MHIDDIVFIPLSHEGTFAIVDVDEADRLLPYRWFLSNRGYVMRVRRATDPAGAAQLMMHRSILECPPGLVVDHINHTKHDNRKSNLRCATKSQNAANSGPKRQNTSGFRGVSWDRRRSKWAGVIGDQGKNRFLGYFDCPKEAARVYDTALRELHGEYARLNFPDES